MNSFIKNTLIIFTKFYFYSGLQNIFEKIHPPIEDSTGKRKSPTFVIWIIGIYIAFYGVASQRYENTVHVIENRANLIFSQLSTPAIKEALSRIAQVQNMKCPTKPIFTKPTSVFKSLFGNDERYGEIVSLFKNFIEDWKEHLDNLNLSGIDLEGANLSNVNFNNTKLNGANLRNCNLENAILTKISINNADLSGVFMRGSHISFSMIQIDGKSGRPCEVDVLSKVKSLYSVQIDNVEIKNFLLKEHKDLFEEPGFIPRFIEIKKGN